MAERITEIKRLKKSPEQIKSENLNEVIDAIAENKDSILKAIRLINTLDEAKILDALNGGFKARQVIINKFAVELNKDIYTGLLSNIGANGIPTWRSKCKDLSDMLNRLNKGLHVANQASPNARTSIRNLMGILKTTT